MGTVCRLVTFGAFVTLTPGVDGLVHISKLGQGRRINSY
ncbi:MAG: S1 RNA-binding domain-containing protein [Cellulophaga baltica]